MAPRAAEWTDGCARMAALGSGEQARPRQEGCPAALRAPHRHQPPPGSHPVTAPQPVSTEPGKNSEQIITSLFSLRRGLESFACSPEHAFISDVEPARWVTLVVGRSDLRNSRNLLIGEPHACMSHTCHEASRPGFCLSRSHLETVQARLTGTQTRPRTQAGL